VSLGLYACRKSKAVRCDEKWLAYLHRLRALQPTRCTTTTADPTFAPAIDATAIAAAGRLAASPFVSTTVLTTSSATESMSATNAATDDQHSIYFDHRAGRLDCRNHAALRSAVPATLQIARSVRRRSKCQRRRSSEQG